MKKPLTIGVFLPFALAFGRSILQGVQAYAQGQPRWRLTVSDTAHAPPAPDGFDGMIGSVGTKTWREFAVRCPAAVNISNSMVRSPVPQVISDDRAVGRMAADHLLHQGFRRFAFVRSTDRPFARQRQAGYEAALAEAGYASLMLDNKTGLARTLDRLKKPVAVFTMTDTVARLQIQRLVERGLRVPEEVAVLGVDDDPLESQIAPVAISSVVLDGERIGHEAGRLLGHLLHGGAASPEPVRVPPLYVAARRSTDRFTASHPLVAKALHVMQKQAADLATVDAVAGATGVSRRTLERLFRKEIGTPIYQELCRAKLESIMPDLLRGSAPMFELAARAGFTDARLFNNVCRRIRGKPPGQLRREAQV